MADELFAATRRALLHRIATGQVDGRAPSLVGAVVRDGTPVWIAARGDVDGSEPTSDTQYRIGSISKMFVAVLVMRLRDEGRLDLADSLGVHLPGTAVGDLRIAELLAHTSGLASESAGPWWERTPGQADIAEALGQQPMRLPAGRQFHYSNPGYGVLGALVERLRGEPWGVVLQREVLDPLSMTRTTLMPQAPHARGWAVHPWADVVLSEPAEDARAMAPAGQLWSTVDDLCRWAAFLADRRRRMDGRLRARRATASNRRADAQRAHRVDAGLRRDGLGQRRGTPRRPGHGQRHVRSVDRHHRG
jgi:CubicO group peptidase (beta-lactamase class C family)